MKTHTILPTLVLALALSVPCLNAAEKPSSKVPGKNGKEAVPVNPAPQMPLDEKSQKRVKRAHHLAEKAADREFGKSPQGIASKNQITAVEQETNAVYEKYLNIFREDSATEKGKILRQERGRLLQALDQKQQKIEADYEAVKKTSPAYSAMLEKHLQSELKQLKWKLKTQSPEAEKDGDKNNPAISQPTTHTIMITPIRIKAYARLLVLSVTSTLTCAAEENVPYDLSQETYKTETLFSYDGCVDHRLMGNSGQPKVFKNHVYLATIAYGLRPRILQVPLDGGEAKIGHLDPDFSIGEDSHRYFTVTVDKAGYIHVTGGMHGGPWRYWISAKPEDVSRFIPAIPTQISKEMQSALEDASDFVPTVPGQLQGPPGYGITYPQFSTDTAGNLFLYARGSTPSFQKSRPGKIVHVGILSTYDAEKRAWGLLGADIPKVFGGHPGHPVSVWEDNFSNGPAGGGSYVRNITDIVSDRDNTLHFCFKILNYSSTNGRLNDSEEGGGGRDILYATSKDGGRTLQRANGSKVEWPVRAEVGPYQPDVIYAAAADYDAAVKKDGPFQGLVGGAIQLDWKGRPMIAAHGKNANATVAFRLENGKWVSFPAQAFGSWRDNAGVLMSNGDTGEDWEGAGKHSQEVTRLWDENHSRVVKLGQDIDKLDKDYLRDTGTMIYTTKSPRPGNKVINIMRTTIQRPQSDSAR